MRTFKFLYLLFPKPNLGILGPENAIFIGSFHLNYIFSVISVGDDQVQIRFLLDCRDDYVRMKVFPNIILV